MNSEAERLRGKEKKRTQETAYTLSEQKEEKGEKGKKNAGFGLSYRGKKN